MFIVYTYLFDYLPVKMGIPQSFPCMWVFGKLRVILITSDWITLLIMLYFDSREQNLA